MKYQRTSIFPFLLLPAPVAILYLEATIVGWAGTEGTAHTYISDFE